jgi:uroporphyrin-3 C-methyltransferase
LALIALLVALATALALWYVAAAADRAAQDREAVTRRVVLVEEENAQLRRQMSALTRRFDDDDALDRSLREELLGVSERAALLEQAIKRVSENRMDSVSELRLNQAELLLSAGIERLRLFHDAQAAATALRLADNELARLEDPRYAGVRQTLAQEIAALDAVPQQALSDSLVLLAELRARLPNLPLRGDSAAAAPAAESAGRFETLLRGLVRVRRVSPREAGLLGPLGADTLRAVIALDLLHAEQALRQHDVARYQALIAEARETLTFGFDLDAASTRDVRLKLTQLAAYKPAPWPDLGLALEQLVNLRHTHDVARGVER